MTKNCASFPFYPFMEYVCPVNKSVDIWNQNNKSQELWTNESTYLPVTFSAFIVNRRQLENVDILSSSKINTRNTVITDQGLYLTETRQCSDRQYLCSENTTGKING